MCHGLPRWDLLFEASSIQTHLCLAGAPTALSMCFLAESCFYTSVLFLLPVISADDALALNTFALPHFSRAPPTAGPTGYDQHKLGEWPLLLPFQEHGRGHSAFCMLSWKRWWLYRKQEVGQVSSYLICCGWWWQSCREREHPQGGLQLLGR